MVAEDTLKLLWDCGNALSPETHTKKLLKSYYINTCRKIAKNRLQMPKEKFAASQLCSRCSCLWSEGEFRLKLRPQQLPRSAKARKLIAKLEEAKSTHKKGLLSKKQRRRAKWLQKRVTSNVEIHCDYCQQRTLVPLNKPKKEEKHSEAVEEIKQVESIVPKVNKKKKNKPKNNMAGLKITTATLTAATSKMEQTNISLHKGQKVLTEGTEKKPVSMAIQKPAKISTPTTPTKSATLTQSLKAKKKKKKNHSGMTPSVAPKSESKTQHKNSLLQLAALLRTQAAKPANNTSKNRLDSLLK